MEDRRANETRYRVLAVAGLCALAVLCNVYGPLVFSNARPRSTKWHLVFVAIGGLAAEVCLLSIWCGLSVQPIKSRLPITTALVVVAICSFVFGMQVPASGAPLGGSLILFGTALVGFAILQLPLWLVRCLTCCRIATLEEVPQSQVLPGTQYSLGYLMFWTTLVGVLLAVVRNSLPDAEMIGPLSGVIQISLVLVTYACWSAFLCVPAVWIVLGQAQRLPASVLLVAAIAVGPVAVYYFGYAAMRRPPLPLVMQISYSYAAGLVATTLAVLLVLRRLDYRFIAVQGLESESI